MMQFLLREMSNSTLKPPPGRRIYLTELGAKFFSASVASPLTYEWLIIFGTTRKFEDFAPVEDKSAPLAPEPLYT